MEPIHLCVKPEESAPSKKGCDSKADLDLDPEWALHGTTSASLWTKARDFIGVPNPRDFRMSTAAIPELEKREILVEALCWSVENYMREFKLKPGSMMIGEQVGCVVASRHRDYPPMMLVVCSAGWRTCTVINPDVMPVKSVKDIKEYPLSVCLGPLGFPGLSAYFGFLEICEPKPGNIVLINAAAGSINSVVGQLAKLKGCTVIAFAASKDRCDWIRELGFDYVYCKSVTVSAALARQAPGGVDFFFDCVGAEFTKGVVQHMKPDGTICVFGYNSCYGRRVEMASERQSDPYRMLYMRNGKVTCCSVYDFRAKFSLAQAQLLEWMHQGKLRFRETMFDGFEKLPDALKALYDETSVGTVLVKSSRIDSLRTSVVEL